MKIRGAQVPLTNDATHWQGFLHHKSRGPRVIIKKHVGGPAAIETRVALRN